MLLYVILYLLIMVGKNSLAVREYFENVVSGYSSLCSSMLWGKFEERKNLFNAQLLNVKTDFLSSKPGHF